jgi:hypothetical protein
MQFGRRTPRSATVALSMSARLSPVTNILRPSGGQLNEKQAEHLSLSHGPQESFGTAQPRKT